MKQSFRAAPSVETIGKLSEKIHSLGLEIDTEIIRNAYQYSKKAHEGQKRQSGEPYISHPLNCGRDTGQPANGSGKYCHSSSP